MIDAKKRLKTTCGSIQESCKELKKKFKEVSTINGMYLNPILLEMDVLVDGIMKEAEKLSGIVDELPKEPFVKVDLM